MDRQEYFKRASQNRYGDLEIGDPITVRGHTKGQPEPDEISGIIRTIVYMDDRVGVRLTLTDGRRVIVFIDDHGKQGVAFDDAPTKPFTLN